jgi:uncharacterized protein (DUF2236 family)
MPLSDAAADALRTIAERVAARARGPREGLFGPHSAMWRIARENVLFAGAPRALLLQLAHPAVLSGVIDHSHVATDPFGRSVRTFEAMYTLAFGDLESALRVVGTVWRRHQSVRGTVTPDTTSPASGTPYHATDPGLLLWVWATLEDTMLRTFETFVRPLSAAERASFHEEAKTMPIAFGMREADIPPTVADFDAYVKSTIDGPMLDVTSEARRQWEILRRERPSSALVGALMLPRQRALSLLIDGSPVRLLAPAVARLFAGAMLPPRLREAYGVTWSRADAAMFALLAEATRRSVATLPWQLRYHAAYRQAARRLGRRRAA